MLNICISGSISNEKHEPPEPLCAASYEEHDRAISEEPNPAEIVTHMISYFRSRPLGRDSETDHGPHNAPQDDRHVKDVDVGSTFAQLLRRFSSDSLLYSLSSAATMFIGMMLIPVFTRVFEPSDFGVIEMIASMVAIGIPIGRLGMNNGYGRFYFEAKTIDDRQSYVGSAVLFILGWSTLLVVFGILGQQLAIDLLFKGNSKHLSAYILALVGLPASLMAETFNNLLRFMMKTKRFVVLAIGRTSLILVLTIVFVVVIHLSVEGVYLARVVGAGVGVFAGYFLVRSEIGWCFSWPKVKEMLAFGFPYLPSSLLTIIAQYSDRWFIAHYMDLSEVGLYSITVRVSQILGLVTYGVLAAWPPMALIVYNQGRAKTFLPRALLYATITGVLVVVPISLFAREILMVLTSPAYYSAARLVPYYLLVSLLNFVVDLVGVGILLTKRTWFWLLVVIIKSVLIVGLDFILVSRMGAVGAILALLIAELGALVVVYYCSQTLYFLAHPLWRYLKLALMLGASFLVIHLLQAGQSLILLKKVIFLVALSGATWFVILNDGERRVAMETVKRMVQAA